MPVTSYIKMVDIWMLFTMTIPFLEVVYHTSNEMFKQSDVARVTPHNWSEEDEMPNTNSESKAQFLRRTQRLVLPTSSLLFTLIFWIRLQRCIATINCWTDYCNNREIIVVRILDVSKTSQNNRSRSFKKIITLMVMLTP